MPDLAEQIFLALFALCIIETVWTELRQKGKKGTVLGVVRMSAQLLMSGFALYLAVRSGALDRRLFSLVEIVPGLLGGHLIFVGSVLLTHASLRDSMHVLRDWESIRDFFVTNPNLAFRTVQLAVTEELIYRAVLQTLLVAWWGVAPAIAMAAFCFAISHEHVFRNTWRETAEFAAFSLLLGALYYATSSLAAVTAIHAVRNFEISLLEFSARVHETGSEEEAQQELDQRYRQESLPSP